MTDADAMSVSSDTENNPSDAVPGMFVAEDFLVEVLEQLVSLRALLTEEQDDSYDFQVCNATCETELKPEDMEVDCIANEKVTNAIIELQSILVALKKVIDGTKLVMSDDPVVVEALKVAHEMIAVEASPPTVDMIELLSCHIAKALEKIRPVDIDKLGSLLEESTNAGRSMAGKDVLLMLGGTGAGKTTTILFLAGTTFEEVEVDGDFHLSPLFLPDPKLETFQACNGSSSTTKRVQCVEVNLDREVVILCDIPGFGDTAGVEVDIANGMGVVKAIRQAKSVIPVLVFSQNGIGDRFQGVYDTLETVSRLFGGNLDDKCLKACRYLFTKFDMKYKSILWKKFKKEVQEMMPGSPVVALLKDISVKTCPKADLVMPLEGNSEDLLKNLWKGNDGEALDPKSVFTESVSQVAENKLQLQLQYTKVNFDNALRTYQQHAAERYLKQLKSLSTYISEVSEVHNRCCNAAHELIKDKLHIAPACVLRFQTTVNHATFKKELQNLQTIIANLMLLGRFCDNCMKNRFDVPSRCSKTLGNLVGAAGKTLFEFDQTTERQLVLHNTQHYATCIRFLREICLVFFRLARKQNWLFKWQ